jgi:hypothetical protein
MIQETEKITNSFLIIGRAQNIVPYFPYYTKQRMKGTTQMKDSEIIPRLQKIQQAIKGVLNYPGMVEVKSDSGKYFVFGYVNGPLGVDIYEFDSNYYSGVGPADSFVCNREDCTIEFEIGWAMGIIQEHG